MTFLFTDMEGSTRRWEEDRDAMRLAVARHDEVVRGPSKPTAATSSRPTSPSCWVRRTPTDQHSSGGRRRHRSVDPALFRRVLYRLSYPTAVLTVSDFSTSATTPVRGVSRHRRQPRAEVSVDKARFLIETHLRTGKAIGELAKAHGIHRSWL